MNEWWKLHDGWITPRIFIKTKEPIDCTTLVIFCLVWFKKTTSQDKERERASEKIRMSALFRALLKLGSPKTEGGTLVIIFLLILELHVRHAPADSLLVWLSIGIILIGLVAVAGQFTKMRTSKQPIGASLVRRATQAEAIDRMMKNQTLFSAGLSH